MKKWLDRNKVAMLTGAAIQDDETFKSEGGFIPERDQYYFQMQQGGNVFLVGFKDLLTCLRLLEKMGKFLKSAINGGCRCLHFTEMISLW